MQQNQEVTTKERILRRLTAILHQNRIWLGGLVVALLAFVAIYSIAMEVQRKRIESATVLAERAQELFSTWSAEEEEESRKQMGEQLLEDLARIIEDYPRTYATQRAFFVRGSLYFRTEDWDLSAADFASVAERFPGSYLAPVALVNAGVAMEEKEAYMDAIAFYLRVLDEYPTRYPGIPAVLFDIGRLSETTGDLLNAQAYYERIVDEYPSSGWTSLARNRIIYLGIGS